MPSRPAASARTDAAATPAPAVAPPPADPHGRAAQHPLQIPLRGWRDILSRVYAEFVNDRILLVAAGTTFYALLALVPALTALISIYGLFTDPASAQQHLAFVQPYLPDGGQQIVSEQLQRLSSQPGTRLGFALLVSLAVTLWSANAGMKALFEAMNVAYGEAEKRSFVRVTLLSFAFTVGAILLMLLLIGVMIVLPIVIGLLGLSGEWWLRLGSTVVLGLAALTALSLLYRWGPSRRHARWQWITPGAAMALVVAFIASTLFSWYVRNFGSYNETYGSLGALIGFMTWLWIMFAFVITGAELNAEMEHQTARDSTVGPEQPLGRRGAQMADTVAQGPDDVDSGQSAAFAAKVEPAQDPPPRRRQPSANATPPTSASASAASAPEPASDQRAFALVAVIGIAAAAVLLAARRAGPAAPRPGRARRR
ncbi:MAG: YihY/virulence factor BrkB family protein [Lautropia sp.]